MTDPRFLLAKYVPDLDRMEPRNIGLLLWNRGQIVPRFLPSDAAGFVEDREAYGQWVEFWSDLVASETIDAPGQPLVPRKDEKCLEAILSTQAGEYMLVDAGFVPQKIAIRDTLKAADYLFHELVAPPREMRSSSRQARQEFTEQCAELFDRTGLSSRKDFRKRFPVECEVWGVQRHFHCSYGLGNGIPENLFQRVLLSKEQDVNHSALLLHAVTHGNTPIVDGSRCAVLMRGQDAEGPARRESLDLLRTLNCEVVDVDQMSEAVDKVLAIAV